MSTDSALDSSRGVCRMTDPSVSRAATKSAGCTGRSLGRPECSDELTPELWHYFSTVRRTGSVSVAKPVTVGREDERRRAHQSRTLAERGGHDADLPGEVELGMRAERFLQRIEQQRTRLR